MKTPACLLCGVGLLRHSSRNLLSSRSRKGSLAGSRDGSKVPIFVINLDAAPLQSAVTDSKLGVGFEEWEWKEGGAH